MKALHLPWACPFGGILIRHTNLWCKSCLYILCVGVQLLQTPVNIWQHLPLLVMFSEEWTSHTHTLFMADRNVVTQMTEHKDDWVLLGSLCTELVCDMWVVTPLWTCPVVLKCAYLWCVKICQLLCVLLPSQCEVLCVWQTQTCHQCLMVQRCGGGNVLDHCHVLRSSKTHFRTLLHLRMNTSILAACQTNH